MAKDGFIEIPKAVDPHLRRWMLFVDGENFTIRAQDVAKRRNLRLVEGDYYWKDVFIWFPEHRATLNLTETPSTSLQLQKHAIRAHYYTSLVGDDPTLMTARQKLWERGFHPEVFKKVRGDIKAKGVDIALSKDLLSHAFLNNYEVAVLIAGDGDYIPLISEVKRLGKVVYLLSFLESGLNPDLRLAADQNFEMEPFFYDCWVAYGTKLIG
jgi:NYN domain